MKLGVVKTIDVGNGPTGVVAKPDGTRVYVAHNSTVSVISCATNTVTNTLLVEPDAAFAAVNPAGTRVFLSHFRYAGGASGVSAINTTNHNIAHTPLNGQTWGVAVSPDGARVYATSGYPYDDGGSVVYVIDATSLQIIATIDEILVPRWVAVSPDGSRVYVTTTGPSEGLSIIDAATHSVVDHLPLGVLGDVKVSPDGSRIYLTQAYSENSGAVLVVDAQSQAVVQTIPVGGAPGRVAVTADGSRLFVTGNTGDPSNTKSLVTVLDLTTNAATDIISLGFGAPDVATIPLAEAVDTAYVPHPFEDTVSVIGKVFKLEGWHPPDLVGQTVGGVDVGGGGWIIVGNHFYKVPPRDPVFSSVLTALARVSTRFSGKPVENRGLAAKLRKMR